MFSLQIKALPNAVARMQAEVSQCQYADNHERATAASVVATRRRSEELRERIVAYIRQHGPVAGSKVSFAHGFSTNQGILVHLHALAERGLIRQVGTRKGSRWEIVKECDE